MGGSVYFITLSYINPISFQFKYAIINTYSDTQPQFIASNYITCLPRWSLVKIRDDTNGNNKNNNNGMQLKRLVGTGITTSSSSLNEAGFVNPTSFDQLWWPMDMHQIQIRPTIDVLLKKGFHTNIMAGMQVRIPPSSSANGIEWYNYGLHSQPLAYRWTNIPMIYETNFKVQLYLGNMKQEEEEEQQPVESINNKNNKK